MARTLHLTLLAAVITAVAADCPEHWKSFRDMCYWGSDDRVHWTEVKEACNSAYPGSEMVTIHDHDQNIFIAEHVAVNHLGGRRGAWIGLSRANSTASWTWTDGSEVDYTSWYMGDENFVGGDYGMTNYGIFSYWVGYDSTIRTFFLCQTPAT